MCAHARGWCVIFNSSQQQVFFLSQLWDLNYGKCPALDSAGPRSSAAGCQAQGQGAVTQMSSPFSSTTDILPFPVFVTVLAAGTSWEGDPAVCPGSGSCAHSHRSRHYNVLHFPGSMVFQYEQTPLV